MNFAVVMRYAIMILSATAAVMGVLIMTGLLVPRSLPEQFRLIIGAVVFLYGIYRFSIAYFQKSKAKHDESL
jgi:hypothetical protein